MDIHSVNQGYQVSFILMDHLIYILKMREHISKSKAQYKRIIASDLIIIDDIMLMDYDPQDAQLFFQFSHDM
ncbi:ATP-binding protein [Salinicoccus sp. HZC-1]|uniref:ATP-binding protein n=1 Tax=Salinicoccus sp. HZC-1 TaxID=3385497 RepID=UPI00398B45B6